ncbi:hypothetical protein OsJ_07721 [Oryza sativa Japonica Group]|uniref:Protein kinase domain-containing protein n=1 Tax=Oryza sativa subsp. japonica TaxID=39947 RepID=B9F1D4_ORYSJ|nr:hypothetical protein OsJ_07721 [Oryza sativa Japonica Group]
MLDGCGLLAFARCCCVGGGEMESDARVSDEPGCGGGGGGGAGSVVEKGGGVVARRFGWAEIESVTGGFSSRVIGQGGFSTVYLASLTSSRLGAVKVQRSSERLHRAFCQERDVLLSLRHPHVVRLLGYCDERDEGVLVFEYAPNGDLHERLHHRSGGKSRTSSNVLLDANHEAQALGIRLWERRVFRPRFGPPSGATQGVGPPPSWAPRDTRTRNSSAPAWPPRRATCTASACCCSSSSPGREAICAQTGHRLTAAVGPSIGEGKLADVVDRRLGGDYDVEEAATVAALALRCVSDGTGLRPSMAEVVRELQEKTTALISAVGSKPSDKMVS